VGRLVEMAARDGKAGRPGSRSASAASTAAIRHPSGSSTHRPRLRLLLAVPRSVARLAAAHAALAEKGGAGSGTA